MTCADFKDQVALYVLGALDEAEAHTLEAHLYAVEVHEGCLEALAEARATLAALDASHPEVHERVWRGIEAQVAQAQGTVPAPRLAPSTSVARERARRRVHPAAGWLVAAAAGVALLVSFGRVRGLRAQLDARSREVQLSAQGLASVAGERAACQRALEAYRGREALQREALALLEAPGSRLVTLAPVAGTGPGAKAVYSPTTRRAVVVASGVKVAPGQVLQLWVLRGQAAPVAAGFLAIAEAQALGQVDPAALTPAPDAFAVSLEPAGGSASPTRVLMVGRLAG